MYQKTFVIMVSYTKYKLVVTYNNIFLIVDV